MQIQSHKLFSVHDHPNTLAAVGGADGRDHLWVLLHNLGAVSTSVTADIDRIAAVQHSAVTSHSMCMSHTALQGLKARALTLNKYRLPQKCSMVVFIIGIGCLRLLEQ